MTVIVTGATGQFGRSATRFLLERLPPDDLILVTRKPDDLADLAARGVAVRHGDFDAPDTLVSAFEGGERMLLISTARVGGRLPQHKAAVDAAKAAGVRQVAYTSFARTGPEGVALVAVDHAGTEALLAASGMAYTYLRDGWYADAIATAIAPRALAEGRWITSSRTGRSAPVARDDCAACAAVVLTEPGHEDAAYDLTGPDLVSVPEIAALVCEIGGGPIEIAQVTDDDMYAMFDALGVPRSPIDDAIVNAIPWCSDDMVSFERAIREGCLDVRSDDVERLLGRPPVSLRAVLEAHGAALRAAAASRS